MSMRKLSACLSIRILILLFMLCNVLSIDKELPSFIELPPHIQYYAPGKSSIELSCNIWPSTAKVQFMVSSKKIWSTALNPTKNAIELNLLDRNIGELISPGKLRISNQNHLMSIQDQNIHCLISTDFATVLSRPFMIKRAVMSEFGGDLTNQSKTVVKSFLRENVAIIDCWPPESHPRPEVKFNFNSVEIKDGGKYRIVHWSDGKRVSLLVHSVKESDVGQYRCLATNPVTGLSKLSGEVIDLKVEVPQTIVAPSITVPISGRINGAQQIIVRKGANVTLFCVMRGSPAPQIQITNMNNDLTTSDRYSMDRQFGLLSITDVRQSDGGSYMCKDNYITSSAVLKIIEPLNITTRPMDVELDSLAGSAKFDCVLSKGSVTVQWFFNGRPITASSNGSVLLPSVTVTDLGIYQCVAQDREEWVSAQATLVIKSYNLVSRPTARPLHPQVQVPLVHNVDLQEQILTCPNVSRIHDNLAIYAAWTLINDKLGHLSHFVLQIVSKSRGDSAWSTPVTVQDKFNHTYYYVTSRYLKPQSVYRVRVHTFFTNDHTVTSTWSKDIDFFNVGDTAPGIEESTIKSVSSVVIRWSYHSVAVWPVDTFRVLYRQQLANGTQASRKYDKYGRLDVLFPAMSVSITGLEPASTYQITVYGINGAGRSRTITRYSALHTVTLPPLPLVASGTTPATTSRFFTGLFESWKSNKLLYGSLFALTGFLIVVMFLLLLLCLCRQRRFRNSKDSSSSQMFPYSYKEVNKASQTATKGNYNDNNNNNNSSTLQMPGRIPQNSSQLALLQYQSATNGGTMDRHTVDPRAKMTRDNSANAMETASLVTDLYSQNYLTGHMGHPQHPYHGFSSTLPQGYSRSTNPQYQHFLQQQQGHLGGIRREVPIGDSQRDSMMDQSLEMPLRGMSASQQHLMLMQQQQSQVEHQKAAMGYYSGRTGALSPQMVMMMGSQQSLGPYGPYRRSTSQNYHLQSQQGIMETPIAINAMGQPIYQMEHQMALDQTGRPLSPQYQYMQQAAQMGSIHPSMIDMYPPTHNYVRPGPGEYPQHSLYRQQFRRSDSDSGAPEPGYAYLPTNHGVPELMAASRQHTLNSLPEQPMDLVSNEGRQQDSPGGNPAGTTNSNNNSSGRHHHRRKTRSRPQNSAQDNPSLERMQGQQHDLPPMLAPRSKVPYPDGAISSMHRVPPGHEIHGSGGECMDPGGDQVDPPLQYSGHYHPNDDNDAVVGGSGALMMDNVPRIRDVSEYGIPPMMMGQSNPSTGGHARSLNRHHDPANQPQTLYQNAPVPPLKSANRGQIPGQLNGYGLDCQPDYYSSATSSDRSGPSPPPKYAPGQGPLALPEDAYMKSLYYHGDTHC